MNGHLRLLALSLLIFCVIAEVGRELGFKLASSSAAAEPAFAKSVVASPYLWFALALGVTQFFIWFWVLQLSPLTIAYPFVSLAYLGVPIAGVAFLRERMSVLQVIGATLIAFGVACVGLSAG